MSIVHSNQSRDSDLSLAFKGAVTLLAHSVEKLTIGQCDLICIDPVYCQLQKDLQESRNSELYLWAQAQPLTWPWCHNQILHPTFVLQCLMGIKYGLAMIVGGLLHLKEVKPDKLSVSWNKISSPCCLSLLSSIASHPAPLDMEVQHQQVWQTDQKPTVNAYGSKCCVC